MFWNNLFKKKNKIFNTEIVNNVYSKMPSFEELTPEEQEYVSKLKEEYLKFYENEDNYISLDCELFNEIKMYQDLALDIMHKDHFGNIVNSIIDSKKLVYYSHKITEINNILKYKYIALNGLRKDKKYLTKHMGLYVLGKRKINILKALDYQINIINNMFVIADKQIFDYNAKAIANYPKNIDETTKNELNDRYIEVEKDYQDLFNSSIELDDSISIADEITYMEILIDKFIYENKDLINKLKEQLDIIAFNEIIDAKEQQAKISNLKKIKMYYHIFSKYGRNLITKDDFNDLYQIIFNVYTYFPISSGFTEYFNKEANKDELILYSKIIKAKSEVFILKQSKVFETNKISDKVYGLLLKIFNLIENDEIYKNMFIYDDFNIKYFPNVELLLALDFVDGIDKYFDKKAFDHPLKLIGKEPWISKNALKKDYYKYVFGLCINPSSKQDITSQNQYSIDLIKLRQYYESEEIVLYYLLYKDKINFTVLPYLSKKLELNNFINYLSSCCEKDKNDCINIFIPPRTKKVFLDIHTKDSYHLDDINLKRIFLNKDLENLIFYSDLSKTKTNTLVMLPETVNRLSIDFISPIKYDHKSLADIYYRMIKICKSLMLPSKIFEMNDSKENNEQLFIYLYDLLYYFFKDIKQAETYVKYYTIFSNILSELIVFEKNNHLYRVSDYLKLIKKDKSKYEISNDIEEAYKKAIKDYIKNINDYKKYVKLQYIYEKITKSTEQPKKLIKKA